MDATQGGSKVNVGQMEMGTEARRSRDGARTRRLDNGGSVWTLWALGLFHWQKVME